VRDCESLDELSFPVYARGVQPKGPYKNGPGEINIPIAIGGIVVEPGDLVLGDRDGVVVIKKADAQEMLEKGKAHNAMEAKTFMDIAAGQLNRDWVDQALLKINCEIIE
jgi:regulator of RNase E activity RraA